MENQQKTTSNENMARLASKINAITAELGAVGQDGTNTQSHYNYISYEQMNSLMRNLLPKHGLSIIPSIDDIREVPYTTKNGSPGIRSIVKATFLIIDCETGFSIERRFVGADQDVGGKSGGQAVTECTKRFLLKLFHVSSKGDVDPDSRTVESGIPQAGWNGQQGNQQGQSWSDGF
jgi:hypothetical protein